MADLSKRDGIHAMLAAKSVAVVGATDNAGKPGFRLLSYLREFGYKGAIYPINPRQQVCQGLKCYPNLKSLPAVPDLIGVVVAAERVPAIVRDAAVLGVKSAVIVSAGFAEAGAEGACLQAELAEIAASHGILIVGPNSVGVTRTSHDLAVTFTEALTRGSLASGGVGMVSQSGAFGTVLYAQARDRGVGINTYISSGNEASVSLGDYVEALIEEPDIEVVGAYVEGLRDVGALVRASLRSRELNKPIVVLKVGRSDRAGQAAASHTGSMVGNNEAYRAAFSRLGIIQVEDEQELLDTIELLQVSRTKATRGNRVAIVSTSGGAGVLLTDLLEEQGLELAQISADLEVQLRDLLPEFASLGNPIDVTGRFVTDPTGLDEVVTAVAADPGVDLVIVFVGLAWSSQEQWTTAFKAMAEAESTVVVSAPLLDDTLAASVRALGLPVGRSLRQTASACSALVRWGTWQPPADAVTAPVLAHGEVARLPGGLLDEDRYKSLLASIGLAVPRARVATSVDEAVEFAVELDAPVALKAHVQGLAHKSDFGGVLLGLNPEQVSDGYAQIRQAVAEVAPPENLHGVRVEEMVEGGVEILIGAVRAEPFGALVMVGAGGTEVEIKKDLAHGIAPLTVSEAHAMISSLNIFPLLRGYRGGPNADLDALASALVQVSQLAVDLGERLIEMDLNPVLVRPDSQGVVVLDAMAVLGQLPE